MEFIRRLFFKMRDYFTANLGRKIFFFGLVGTFLSFLLYFISYFSFFYYVSLLSLLVVVVGTLWDSMYSRFLFLKKIRDIQYEHLKEISDKQASGEAVVMTPTFSDTEKRYLRRRKWGFVAIILFKVLLVIALFSLLLGI